MENQQAYKQMQEIQSELNLFLKRVRQREDEHYRLLDYTSKILAKKEQPQQAVTQLEEISKSRDFLKRLALDTTHQEKDLALATKCETFAFQEEDSLLTRRVAARILEITYNAIQLRRQANEYYIASYIKFKECCLKGLTETNSKPAWLIRITNRYLSQKMQTQLQRLRQTLNFLQISDFQSLGKIKNSYYSQLKPKELQITFVQRPQKQQKAQKIEIPHQNQKAQKIQSHDNPEKEVKKQLLLRSKAKSSREEQIQTLKLKRKETKKLKRFAASLSEVMAICREDFLQQLAPENKVWQTHRMLHSLVNRNKSNQTFINTFREKQQQFKEKVSKNEVFTSGKMNIYRSQSLQEQLLQKDEKLQQGVISTYTSKDIRISEPIFNKKELTNFSRYEKKQVNRLIQRSGHIKRTVRHKSTFNNIQHGQKLKKESQAFSSQRQIFSQHEFVEINFRAVMPIPKARLPEISSRIVSVDKTVASKKQDLVRSKLELKPTGSNFFQEIQKKISKFCEMKRNLLI